MRRKGLAHAAYAVSGLAIRRASHGLRWNPKGCTVGIIGCIAIVCAQAVRADATASCASLAGMAISAASIGLPTTGANVTAASLVLANAPQNTNGEYCLVRAAVHPVDPTAPDILIEVNLPTNWNGKGLQLGGGGYNGSVVTGLGPPPSGRVAPLSQGYAT